MASVVPKVIEILTKELPPLQID